MAIEDFTTYTEVDEGSDLTVAAAKITAVALLARSQNAYVYKDFTANYFDALSVYIEIQIASGSTDNYEIAGGPCFANAVSTIAGFGTTDLSVFIRDEPTEHYQLFLCRGAFTAYDNTADLSYATSYYLWVQRAAGNSTATCKMYSDASHTTLLDTLTVTGYGTTTKWRYCYGFADYNDEDTNGQWFGFVQNLDLNEASSTDYPISCTVNLTCSPTIDRDFNIDRGTTASLTAAATVAKGWGRTIATSAGLTAAAVISRVRNRTIVTTSTITASPVIAKAVAFARATTSSLSVLADIVAAFSGGITEYVETIVVNLTASVSVNRLWASVRTSQSALSVSTSVSRVVGWSKSITTQVSASAIVSRAVAFSRAATASLLLSVVIEATKRAWGRIIYLSDPAQLSKIMKIWKRL